MRLFLATLIAAFALAAPAQAQTVTAEGGASARGHELSWALNYDDTARTLTVTANHFQLGGLPQLGFPQQAQIVVTQFNGSTLTLDLLTDGTAFDGGAANMIDAGPRTRSGVRLRISADRAAALSWQTNYLPPQ